MNICEAHRKAEASNSYIRRLAWRDDMRVQLVFDGLQSYIGDSKGEFRFLQRSDIVNTDWVVVNTPSRADDLAVALWHRLHNLRSNIFNLTVDEVDTMKEMVDELREVLREED